MCTRREGNSVWSECRECRSVQAGTRKPAGNPPSSSSSSSLSSSLCSSSSFLHYPRRCFKETTWVPAHLSLSIPSLSLSLSSLSPSFLPSLLFSIPFLDCSLLSLLFFLLSLHCFPLLFFFFALHLLRMSVLVLPTVSNK